MTTNNKIITQADELIQTLNKTQHLVRNKMRETELTPDLTNYLWMCSDFAQVLTMWVNTFEMSQVKIEDKE